MARDYTTESLAHDPVHGYIAFVARSGLPSGEISEQEIIDHPWVQRLRHIHQLQTAWWVFPSAEHRRFQHVLGVMHVGSRVVAEWYESLCGVCSHVPSRAYVESLVRMAGLLHDVATSSTTSTSTGSASRTRTSAPTSSSTNWATCCAACAVIRAAGSDASKNSTRGRWRG
jgi:hypothetical protein